MKKLFLAIMLSCFLITNVWALSPTFLQLICSDSDVGCGGTSTFVGNPGDTETFEYQADDFCCTEFSVTDPDGIISTYDSTQVKNGTYAASFAFTGAGAQNDNFIQVNLGAGDGDFTYDFWFWPHAYDDYGNYDFASTTTTTDIAGGTRGCRLKHYHFLLANWKLAIVGATTDTSIALSNSVWYRIEVDFNQNAASTVKIYNASDVLQDTLVFTALNYAPQYLNWGCLFNDVDAKATNYLDDIRFLSGGGGF